MKKILTFLSKFIIILYTCIILNYNSCFADAFKKCTNDELHTIQDYLNSFRTLSTNFIEESKDKKSTGKIYIKKHGLMRIEYEKSLTKNYNIFGQYLLPYINTQKYIQGVPENMKHDTDFLT